MRDWYAGDGVGWYARICVLHLRVPKALLTKFLTILSRVLLWAASEIHIGLQTQCRMNNLIYNLCGIGIYTLQITDAPVSINEDNFRIHRKYIRHYDFPNQYFYPGPAQHVC